MQRKTRQITWGFTIFTLVLAGVFIYMSHYIAVAHTGVPASMPKDAKFVAGKFDWTKFKTHGEWVSCHSDIRNPTDWCRIANESGDVLFEGKFLPVGRDKPMPDSDIHVANYSLDNHWVIGPTETFKVPVVPLEDGTILVPSTDTHTLAARWKAHPEELEALKASGATVSAAEK